MRQCLIITVGVPGCGKSTWAGKICAKKGFVEINRDLLRRELGKFKPNEKITTSQGLEAHVTNVHECRMHAAFADGKTVVCSDTNINPATVKRLTDLAEKCRVPVYFKRFAASSDWALLQLRNKTRPVWEQLPHKVLRDFYTRYREQNFQVAVIHKQLMPKAYIFDIDGTLADHSGLRSPYEWHKVGLDRVKEDVARMAGELSDAGYKIIICTGRDGSCLPQTEAWLKDNNIMYDEIFIRPAGSSEKDSIVKYDIFKNHIEKNYRVLGVFDDRQQVVDMWRKIGLTCFQVAPGAF